MSFDASLAEAVRGKPASSNEYNKMLADVLDLNSRLKALEEHGGGGGGSGVTYSYLLSLDPGNAGFTPQYANSYEPLDVGSPNVIEFDNPGVPVTVFGLGVCHAYSATSTRCGIDITISLDGGNSWFTQSQSPLARLGGSASDTQVLVGQLATHGQGTAPTGKIQIAMRCMRENDGGSFYRSCLYAQVLGGVGGSNIHKGDLYA